MRIQWQVILSIILAIVIAIFAVINTEPVEVNFLFTQANWPLILIILGSVLIGCLIIFCLNVAKVHELNKKIKALNEEKEDLKRQLAVRKMTAIEEVELDNPLSQRTTSFENKNDSK